MNKEILASSPEILKKFLGYLQTVKGRSLKTVGEYFCDLRTFFRYIKIKRGAVTKEVAFDQIDISDINVNFLNNITLTDVFEYVNYLAEYRNNNAASRSRKVSSLRTFFKYLTHQAQLLSANPIEQLETPKIPKSLPKFLTLEQSKKLLDAVIKHGGNHKERDYCIVTLFLNCGLRLSELSGIDMKDIGDDFTLKVRGKGNKERMIYLNEACKVALRAYMSVRPNDRVKDKNALFISRQNNRLSIKTIQFLLNNYFAWAGLSGYGYSAHKLRHTAATLMYQHGNVDIRILKDILGHENLGTTEIYTHLSNKQVQNALESNPLACIQEK